mmetsp:Transcript_11582/g.29368  ORF Transcript_11582/g.29368 Transcript_11582/m.29368 type:complete len:172 (+) Transcript_11582:68-583(+)
MKVIVALVAVGAACLPGAFADDTYKCTGTQVFCCMRTSGSSSSYSLSETEGCKDDLSNCSSSFYVEPMGGDVADGGNCGCGDSVFDDHWAFNCELDVCQKAAAEDSTRVYSRTMCKFLDDIEEVVGFFASLGVIIIVVVVVVIALIVGLTVYCCCCKKKTTVIVVQADAAK